MARFTPDNLLLARKIIARFPEPRSATIMLCHLAQEQDGYLSPEAMGQVAELIGATSAEVLGTASFYEMFKMHPVGKYCVNVCTNISCQLLGGEELLEHAEEVMGIRSGSTTEDGMFTLEDVECVAACTEAPAVQVNYRYFNRVSPEDFDELLEDLRSGGLSRTIPAHGTLGNVRQDLHGDRIANITPPSQQVEPAWFLDGDSDEGSAK